MRYYTVCVLLPWSSSLKMLLSFLLFYLMDLSSFLPPLYFCCTEHIDVTQKESILSTNEMTGLPTMGQIESAKSIALPGGSSLHLVILILQSYERASRNRCWRGWRFSRHHADELFHQI